MAFTLTSTHIADQQTLPLQFVHSAMGAGGQNVSPDLNWSGAPEGTQSYALTMYDPDAPTGSGWWHWVVYDLPAATTSLPEGAGRADAALLPRGAHQGRNDFGSADYGGACPPPGDHAHRYVLTVHALDVASLGLPAGAPAASVADAIRSHQIASGQLVTTFARR